MAVTRAKKQEILKEILEAWQKAKSVIFSGYQGLPVKEMSKLRKELRKGGGEYKIAKKTLIRLAGKKMQMPEISEDLMPGAVGVVFGFEDEMSVLKTVYEFGKKHQQVTLLGGLMEGKILSAAEVKVLAALPGKKELLAKFVGSLKAPISGFHGVLYGVLRNFVFALSEYQKKMATEQPQPVAATVASEVSATSPPSSSPSSLSVPLSSS